MVDKILKSSFILFSVSIVLLAISIIFFNFFKLDILNSAGNIAILKDFKHFENLANIDNSISLEMIYIISTLNIQVHYYPGLTFFGFSLITITLGIILSFIGIFHKRTINETQIQKKLLNNRKNSILKISFIIFVFNFILLFIALTNIIIFQGITPIPFAIIRSLGIISNTITSTGLYGYYIPSINLLIISFIFGIIGIFIFALGIIAKNKETEHKDNEDM